MTYYHLHDDGLISDSPNLINIESPDSIDFALLPQGDAVGTCPLVINIDTQLRAIALAIAFGLKPILWKSSENAVLSTLSDSIAAIHTSLKQGRFTGD